jgi:hypothetical protein
MAKVGEVLDQIERLKGVDVAAVARFFGIVRQLKTNTLQTLIESEIDDAARDLIKAALQEVVLNDDIAAILALADVYRPRPIQGDASSSPNIAPAESKQTVGGPIDMGKAIGDLGASIAKAQRNLDTESIKYEVERASNPLALPTAWRIPKLTANFRFEFERTETKGFNIILYKDQTQERAQNQQTVELEIVSVPPTPDMLAALDRRRFRPLLTASDRKLWIDKLLGKQPELKELKSTSRIALLAFPKDGDDQSVLAMAAEPFQSLAAPKIGLYFMTRDGAAPASLITFGESKTNTPAWYNVIDPIVDLQERLVETA